MDWGTIVAAAATGAVAGVISSLLAPWAQLRAESERGRIERRRKLVDDVRAVALPGAEIVSRDLVTSAAYVAIRGHLSPSVRSTLELEPGSEARPVQVRRGARGVRANEDLDLLLGDVDRLAREWKLE